MPAPLESLANPVGPDTLPSVQSHRFNSSQLEGPTTRHDTPIANGLSNRYGIINKLFAKQMSTIFISHASEDKDLVARPLAELLRARGYDVWFDEYSLKLGDSLRRGIDSGLSNCRYGIVVLSASFFSKEWPQKELDALTTREATEARKLILPVWHAISAREIAARSPMLADKVGVSTGGGLENVVESIIEIIEPPASAAKFEENQTVLYSFRDQNVLDWRKSISGIFDTSGPTSTSWFSLGEIVNALKKIAEPNLNHCFFPTGGGMDLKAATVSHEEGCLELRWSPRWVSLIKPKELRLEVFPGFPSLSYFRLEAAPLEPWADGIDPTKQLSEEVVELAPGEYLHSSVLDEGYHDEYGNEIPLPTRTREVTRYFAGSFVFFAKGSAYNRLRGPFDGYDAQHNKMSAKDFRRFVSDLIRVAALSETELEPDRR